jgi:dipeptidyl aminopeptidase/acylaminoacyl peptidase
MRKIIVAAIVCCLCRPLLAQGTRSDYDRAARLPGEFTGKVARADVQPRWLPDGDHFWYRVSSPGGWEYVFVDAGKGLRRAAFDHKLLAELLTRELGKYVTADRLPLEAVSVSDAGKCVRFRAGANRWKLFTADHRLTPDEQPEEPISWLDRPRPSRRTGEPARLTIVNRQSTAVRVYWLPTEGERKSYGEIASGGSTTLSTFAGHVWLVATPEDAVLGAVETPDGGGRLEIAPDRAPARTSPPRDPLLSPDGKRRVELRKQPGDGRKIYLIESSPKDQLQPKLHSLRYDKPGDAIAVPSVHLIDVATNKEIPVRNDLFPQPWSIDRVHWDPDSSRFTFVYNQRGHQVLRVVAIDANTGEACVVVEETSPTFIDYSHKFFCRHIDATGELIWMSERSGWNHLDLYDARTGAVKNAITRGEWVVRGVERVDEAGRQIWFRASGIRPDEDPYHVHYGRVNFDGTGLVWLTEADGTHEARFSPNGRWLIDTHSRVDRPPVTELRRAADGRHVCVLEQADVSALTAGGWRTPERFVAPGRDGKTPIHGVIFRPTNFDVTKKYPVLEQVYAGPHGSFTPRQFRAWHGAAQSLAELGFVVVQADGMGTSHRSKAFHDVCWKNLADAGFPDRIAWIRAAATKYPQLDLSRVGIYGGSAGGQSAVRALIAHGDFYKAAAADCGCHDNRMDKIWWNEQWMGWPIGPHYAVQSNVTQAHRLTGRLLLTVGELDRNVDPASTMQLVNALIKADKDFELLVVPGAGHGVGESPYAARRRADFFVRHLLGVEPRR